MYVAAQSLSRILNLNVENEDRQWHTCINKKILVTEYPEAEELCSFLSNDPDVTFERIRAAPAFSRNSYITLMDDLHMLPMKTPEENDFLFR